jgi:uncharacterized membrane protein
MMTLRRAFLAMSIAWAVLLPLAPFAASQPAPAPFWYGLAFVVYGAGNFICHQLPARSFHTWSAQWPVCARCTGIYFGAAIVAIIAMVRVEKVRLPPSPLRGYGGPRKPDTTYGTTNAKRRARVLLVVAALPTAITLIYEWTIGVTPSNTIRALSGIPLGAVITFIVVESLRPRRGADLIRSAGKVN